MTMQNLLPFTPTTDQASALHSLQSFCSIGNNDDFLIISGSAGTGKTSILRAATEYLSKDNTHFILSAPTGRAAKIISSKTHIVASTVHSLIYNVLDNNDYGVVNLELKENTNNELTIYFIDESSMLSNWHQKESQFRTPGALLSDFIYFVKAGNKDNKIVFIGDSYQLPPVVPGFSMAEIFSPALSLTYLTNHFKLKGQEVKMTTVMRQSEESGVLKIATDIRQAISSNAKYSTRLPSMNNATQAIYHYLDKFNPCNTESTAIICNTNKDVSWWNNAIRTRLGFKGLLSVGDHVIIQQNTYSASSLWVKGDSGIITGISKAPEFFAGLQFMDVEISMTNTFGESVTQSVKVLLNSLMTDDGRFNPNIENRLHQEVYKTNKVYRESQNRSDDKYLSALRIRHSFAITCHKAQGGEWDNIVVHPYNAFNNLRWLYTAVTRAKHSVVSYIP